MTLRFNNAICSFNICKYLIYVLNMFKYIFVYSIASYDLESMALRKGESSAVIKRSNSNTGLAVAYSHSPSSIKLLVINGGEEKFTTAPKFVISTLTSLGYSGNNKK